MNSKELIRLRQLNQRIDFSDFTTAAELVNWMGCIQAQDYAGAKWAIGNRIKETPEAEVDREFNAGEILRTHVLRPTWHFVTPHNIGWMLQLTAPGIRTMSKSFHKKLGIGDDVLVRSKKIIAGALSDGGHLTRGQLSELLKNKKINTDDIRLGFLLLDAELDGIICSGAKHGKQFTYALLGKRVPKVKYLDREMAIAELAKRYFLSRGPATIQDFSWWSGLGLADCKIGIEINNKNLFHEIINGQDYWFFPAAEPVKKSGKVRLLPAFDEFAIAYKNRAGILQPDHVKETGNGIFKPILIVDGQIAGIWKRYPDKGKVEIEIISLTGKDKYPKPLIIKEAVRYSKFLGKELSGVRFV